MGVGVGGGTGMGGVAQKGAYWQLSLLSSVVGLSFPAGSHLCLSLLEEKPDKLH